MNSLRGSNFCKKIAIWLIIAVKNRAKNGGNYENKAN